MERDEIRFEEYECDGEMDVMVVAYGTMARIAKTSIDTLRAAGKKVGLLRPITVYPFPLQAIREAAGRANAVLTVELSTGQMVEDVRLAVQGQCPVHFYGKTGGNIPTPENIRDEISQVLEGGGLRAAPRRR